jgi:glycosyltransferase involved in cell wall biosynthesis
MTGTTCDFSVVIPTCNRPVQLGVCLRALAEQDYPHSRFELIVVDDGSVTPVGRLISELDMDLDIEVIRQSNQGPGAARNVGAERAKGVYLAFTDDDCAPESGWLSALSTVLTSAPGPILVGGRVVNALPESLCSAASQLIVDLAYEHYNSDLHKARFFASNNMALPSAGFRELGGFDPSFRTSEDRDLCDRWLHLGHSLLFVPEAGVAHFHHLSLASFCRQHVGYGRGAFRYYRYYKDRHGGASSIDGSFYRNIMRQLPRRLTGSARRRTTILFLLMVWQVANTLGFVMEGMRDVRPRGRNDGGGG